MELKSKLTSSPKPAWPGKGGIYLMGDTALTRVKPQGRRS